ncbi:MAG: DUF1573 domain-containing protein, partial [bacterium]|nr:DUF1573 domain-containing protein [bacterium]
MRSGLVFLATLVVLATGVLAGPKLEIKEATFDFGRISQNRILTHDFWLRSVGDDTVRVIRLWPGCGCTQIPLEDS